MQLKGVREELRIEKERNKAVSEHVGLLKESMDQKQTAILELKRKVRTFAGYHVHSVPSSAFSLGLPRTPCPL